MSDIAKLFLFVFVLMGCFGYVANIVEGFYTRRDVAAMRLLLDQRLAVYSGPITDDRRIERLESGMLILHEGQKALTAKVDLLALKLNHYTPPIDTTQGLSILSIPTGQREIESIEPIVIEGRTYSNPKLMQVIHWLEANPDKRGLTVREIETLTGVSKSWVAVAKKYKNETAT